MLPFSDACERNKEPILEVLRVVFAQRARVLEIGSGTGQHAVYFARNLPHLAWYPTERLNYLEDLAARVLAEGGANLHEPTVLDVNQTVWPLRRVDAVFTANTLHIMSWPQVLALFAGVGSTLTAGGSMCIYGPFLYEDRVTAPSNRDFDAMLRERDPLSGLRDLAAVQAAAAAVGMRLSADHALPANNRLLVLDKEPAP